MLIETLKQTTEMNLEELRAEAIKYDSIYLNNVGHHSHNISLFPSILSNVHFYQKSFIENEYYQFFFSYDYIWFVFKLQKKDDKFDL